MHKLVSSLAISVLALSPTWGVAQSVSVPFDPVSAVVQLDVASLDSTGSTVEALGSASLSNGTLSWSVASVDVYSFGGADIHFAEGAGFTIHNSLGSFTFKNLFYASYDNAIIGDFEASGDFGSWSLQRHGLLLDYSARGYLGNDRLMSLKPSSESKPLYLKAPDLRLFDGLAYQLSSHGIAPDNVPLEAVFQTLTVGTPPVPEPGSMALLCGGLGLLAVARWRSARA